MGSCEGSRDSLEAGRRTKHCKRKPGKAQRRAGLAAGHRDPRTRPGRGSICDFQLLGDFEHFHYAVEIARRTADF